MNENTFLKDRKSIREMYEFVKALIDDHNACKTELARSGLMKSIQILIDKLEDAHARMAEDKISLEKQLEEAKKKIPKTKEEITKLLNEAGFHELEEVEGGAGHCNFPSPDMTPKQYAELYRRLYGQMAKADERKLDREIEKIENDEAKLETSITNINDIEEQQKSDNNDELKDLVSAEVILSDEDSSKKDSKKQIDKSKTTTKKSKKKSIKKKSNKIKSKSVH